MSELKIGWAEEIFDFPKPVILSGQFAKRISTHTEKPLTVTAMAIAGIHDQMILCSCDLASVSCILIDRIRKELRENTVGIDPMKVICSAIHTHTGPEYAGIGVNTITKNDIKTLDLIKGFIPAGKKYIERMDETDDDIMSGEELFELIVSKIVKAIYIAWERKTEGSFTNAFGRAAVGMCRRAVYSDGSARMWGDTNTASFMQIEGGSDTGIELLYVHDGSGKLTGIVANIACPAQCVQHRHFISPDYWGEVKKLLRAYFGEQLFFLTLCSAAGDQCPVDLVRWVEPESPLDDPNIIRPNPLSRKADPSMFDLAGMKKAGRRVAREIIDVYEDGIGEPMESERFVHKVLDLHLPLRRVTPEEVLQAEKEIRDYFNAKAGDIDYIDNAKLFKQVGILSRARIQEETDVIPTEIHIVRLGTVAFMTNPFELFLDYGNRIRARSHAEQTFIVELANGEEGYLPTEKAEKGGHYSAVHTSGQIGHIGGDQLVRETISEINRLFDEL